jgi:uncharacterized protein YgbK (DUF1537 family)
VLIESQREIIASLARLEPGTFQIEKRAAKPAQSLALVVGKHLHRTQVQVSKSTCRSPG